MLRPDFTVPVVQMHMEMGAEPARYTYAGEVFRAQEEAAHRAPGISRWATSCSTGPTRPAPMPRSFALVADGLRGQGFRAATGDIGLIIAAVNGLSTTPRRKAALMRHIWRPRRFRALLERFAGRAPAPEGRAALIAAADPARHRRAADRAALTRRDRGADRGSARRCAAPPIPAHEVRLIADLLSLRETSTTSPRSCTTSPSTCPRSPRRSPGSTPGSTRSRPAGSM
jgi:ATP phosphoribosyltransferase regulatory subunit